MSTTSKLRMLEPLFDDWSISDGDVSTICASVTDEAESARLAAYINSRLLDMQSIGQGTQVRLYRDSMP